MPQAGSPAAAGCCRQDLWPEAGVPHVTVTPATSQADQPCNADKAGQHPAASRPEGPPAAAPSDATASWQPGPGEQRHSAGATEQPAIGLQEAGSAPAPSDPGAVADQPAQHTQAVAGKAGCLAGYHWQLPPGLSEIDCAWVWVGPDGVAGLAHLQMTLNRQGVACLPLQAQPACDPAASLRTALGLTRCCRAGIPAFDACGWQCCMPGRRLQKSARLLLQLPLGHV